MKTSAALRHACDYFAQTSPSDAPPLLRSYEELEEVGGFAHIVRWFARSLEASNYDFGIHPLLVPYARGVLASPYAPDFITQDKTLQQRFTARQLKGLGPGHYWEPSFAPIRCASLRQQMLFLNDPPPPQSQGTHTVVSRQDANVPFLYTPESKAFLQLEDEFVAHATDLAPYKRLPPGWEVDKRFEVFGCTTGVHRLWVVNSDYGWVIERKGWGGPEEVLANFLANCPVLCDSYVTAAWLAEEAHAGLPPPYLLTWIPIKES
jgi:hypothetical protein